MKKLIAVTLFSLVASGCSTIHFDRTTPVSGQTTKEQWHHNFAFALYEGSAPVDAKAVCGQQSWTSVKTEQTFVNGLASIPANIVGPIWYPKTVTVSCN
jgi:hypothetical protein